jgi:hypothetical protein
MSIMKYRKRLAVTALVLVLALLSVGLVRRFRPDPHVARVRELGELLRADVDGELSPERRREIFQEIRKELEQIPPEKRSELFDDGRRAFMGRIDHYFELATSEERDAYLDSEIDRMEERARQWEERRVQRQDGGAPPGFGAGGGRGNRAAMNDEERLQRRKQRLDAVPAEVRAKRAEYFRALNQRRQERGMAPGNPGGRR